MADDSKTKILAEATRLFGNQGYAATSVREVVEAAGVTKPTLYYYFENKESLFREAVSAQLDGLQALIHLSLTSEGSVRSRLASFLEAYVLGGLQNPDAVRLMMTATSPTDASQPRLEAASRFLKEVEILEAMVEQAIASGECKPSTHGPTLVALVIGSADMNLLAALAGKTLDPSFATKALDHIFVGVGS